MKGRRDRRGSTYRSDRTVIVDLVVVVATVVAVALLAYARLGWLGPFRTLLGLVSVLLLPGYVTLETLLRRPVDDSEPDLSEWVGPSGSRGWPRPTWAVVGPSRLEWLVLSFLVSLVVVPLLGLLLSLTGVEIRPNTVVSAVTVYTVLFAIVAAVRRLASDRNGWSPFEAVGTAVDRVKAPPTRTDALLNLTLAFLVVFGGAAVVAPGIGQEEARFTEFYVLSGGGSADPVMSDYLSTDGTDGTERLVTGISNRERQQVTYTVVVQVQRAEVGDRSVRVLDRRRVSTFSTVLPHNESVRVPYEVNIGGTATGCRVAFLLYRGDVPDSPTVENAYRELHLWDVETPPPEGPACSSLDAVDVRVVGEGVGP